MILMTALAMGFAPDAAEIAAPRLAFDNCLEQVERRSRAQGVAAEAFAAALDRSCNAEAEALEAALVRYDVETGTPRAEAVQWAEEDIVEAKRAAVRRYGLATR